MTVFDDLAAEQQRRGPVAGVGGRTGQAGHQPEAESAITGTAGDFCRVAARRLAG